MFQFSDIPNLRHLRMVQVIGEVGGVSGAARALSTSQPAVTQAVANLEAEIGTPIFERCATGTYPTPLGQQYLHRIGRFFKILDGALAHITGHIEGSHRPAPQADRMMTGTQMRSLMATCEQGRVAEIAETLGLSPASLFRSARSLERSLGRNFFDRTAQGPIPNRTGTLLAREFRRAVRELDLGRGEALMATGSVSLELVVGALPMAGSHELSCATRAFLTDYPLVKVKLVSGEYHKLLDDLCNSRIDMIFGILRKPTWAEDVNEENMFLDSYCLVARPGHPLTRLTTVTPIDLARYDWVVPASGTPRRRRIDRIFEHETAKPRFNLETSSLTMSKALLLSSDTITLLTRSEIQLDLDLGMLADLPCSFLNDVLPKGVTTRSDWLPTVAHDAFLDHLRNITAKAQHHVIPRGRGIQLAS
jgi:LysR family transcriptional regulator, regulator for genes of the gallate degradation pathway